MSGRMGKESIYKNPVLIYFQGICVYRVTISERNE